jgi:hypothetical protein
MAWDLLNWDCSSLTGWTDGDTTNGTSEISPAGQLRCVVTTAGSGNRARRYQDIGTYPEDFTIKARIYCDAYGTTGNNDYYSIHAFHETDELFLVAFTSDGLFIYTTASGWTEVGTDLVQEDTWQVWQFLVDGSASTVDVYLDNVLKASDVSCLYTGSGWTDGLTQVTQLAYTTSNREAHLDYLQIGTGLITPAEYGTVAISSVSSMSLTGSMIGAAASAISSVSSLSLSGDAIRSAIAAITSTPSMSINGGLIAAGVASINSVPSLSIDGNTAISAIVAIAAASSLSASSDRVRYGLAAIQSVASLAASGQITLAGVVAIQAIASMVADGNTVASASVPISSVSSLTIDAGLISAAVAAIQSVSSLSINGSAIRDAIVQIQSIASLIATTSGVVSASVAIQAIAALAIAGQRTASAAVDIDAVSSISLTGSKFVLAVVAIQSIASMVALNTKIVDGSVTISASSQLEADALSYITQSFGYTGTLTAGDVLVIDVDAMTVKLNGTSTRPLMTGTFPKLYVGTNELRWADGGETPDLDFKTEHEPRYL